MKTTTKNEKRFGTRTAVVAALAGALAIGASTAGCDTAPADDVGSIQLAIQTAPADGLCLRLTADSTATGLKIVKTIALTPNMPSQTQVGGLPVGSVGLVGEVFNVACASVTATTPLTWVSNKQTVTIMADFTQTVTLTLLKAGKVNLGVDFVANTQVEEIKLSLAVTALSATPSGPMLFGLTSSPYLWTVSTAFNYKTLVSVGSEPGFIATAPDGNIAVTVNSNTQMQVLTWAGALKSTLSLGFTAGGVVVDNTGVGWVSSISSPQVMRVANVGGLPAATMLAITAPGMIVAPGIGLATNGTPRVGAGSPGTLLALTSAGAITNNWSMPIVPRGIAGLSDGSLAILGFNTGNNVYRVTAAGVASPVFSMGTAPTRATIVSTSKGVVFASTTGGLLLLKVDGSLQSIQLPGNAIATALAVSVADGRVWVADTTNRLLIVTLP